mmetsp:Transcript_123348/g.343528  ORF Transcript_123348/g.343528 Transcript_123348/m.343528 type:complete len:204 (-) Transcript_123348:315-926(-)
MPPLKSLKAGILCAISPWSLAISGMVKLKTSFPQSFVASKTAVLPVSKASGISSTATESSLTGRMPSSSRPLRMRGGRVRRSSSRDLSRSSKPGRASACASRSAPHCHSACGGLSRPGGLCINWSIPCHMAFVKRPFIQACVTFKWNCQGEGTGCNASKILRCRESFGRPESTSRQTLTYASALSSGGSVTSREVRDDRTIPE